MEDHLGEQFRDYRLTRRLGGGNFGDVYLGEHKNNKMPAAVKILKDSEELKDYINEISSLFRLQHPNIVPLLDFGIERDIPFLIMAYAPNGTLRQPKGTRLPLDTIVKYTQQIAEALQYAHDRRVVHRDVKPDNILLGPNGQVWLSDFGITVAVHSSRSLATQGLAGTIPYMAPEQILGKPRPASDQYALGIIVYEWICGVRPFKGTTAEIAAQHTQSAPQPLREKVPMLPSPVEDVVLKALEKIYENRFGTVREFSEALAVAVSGSVTPVAELEVTPVLQPEVAPVPKPETTPSAKVHTSGRGKQIISLLRQIRVSPVRSRIIISYAIFVTVVLLAVALFGPPDLIKNLAPSVSLPSSASDLTATPDPQILFNTITKQNPDLSYALTTADAQSANDWQNGSSYPSCVFTARGYSIIAPIPGQYVPCILQNKTFQDFAFQIQINIIQDGAGGLILRSNAQISRFYRFSIDSQGNYVLLVCARCTDRSNVNAKILQSGTIAKLGNLYTLTVIAIKNTIYLYVNGEFAGSASDSTNSTGELGLYAASTNQVATVEFTAANIWKL